MRRWRRDGRRAYGPAEMAQLVERVIAQHGIGRAVAEEQIHVRWLEIVGDRLAKHASPQHIVRGTLLVSVDSSAWLHQLNMMREQLLSQLLTALGEPRLFTELRFVLAGRSAPATRRPSPPAPQPAVVRAKPQTSAITIAAEVDTIEDPELRMLLGAIRMKHLR